MLILNGNKCRKVPECTTCSNYMIPKDLEMESGQWKCPHCLGEVITNKGKIDA